MADSAEEWRGRIHHYLLSEGKQHLRHVASYVPRPPGCTDKLLDVVDDSRFILEQQGKTTWLIEAAVDPDCEEEWRRRIHSFLVHSEDAHLLMNVPKSVPRPPGCTKKMIDVVRDDLLDRFELTLQGATTWWIAAKDIDGHAAMEADGAAPAAQWEEEWEDEFDSHG